MNLSMCSRILASIFFTISMARLCSAQINSGTNTGWTAWQSTIGNMIDPVGDQQTGQGSDDIVGDGTYAALQSQAGEASFDSGVDYLFLRARFDSFDADNKWGNGGNWGTGMDIDGDGDLDLIMMFSEGSGKPANRSREITFGTPGTGANDGPSTTSWTFPTQTAITLTAGDTYNVANATTTDSGQLNGDDDAWLTFGLSFADLQAAIRAYAVTNAGNSTQYDNYVLDFSSRIAFVAFTSTQNNALNQDLAGTSGNTAGTGDWASYGAITPPMGPGGFIPEPSTYAQMGAFVLIGGVLMYRRRQRAKALAKQNSPQGVSETKS